jgi:hypothetical protein
LIDADAITAPSSARPSVFRTKLPELNEVLFAPFAAIAAGAKLATASEMPRIAANETAKIVFVFIATQKILSFKSIP